MLDWINAHSLPIMLILLVVLIYLVNKLIVSFPHTFPIQDPRIRHEKVSFIGQWRWWRAFHREQRATRRAETIALQEEQRARAEALQKQQLAAQAAIDATKPKPPPPKSKRPSGSERLSKATWQRLGPGVWSFVIVTSAPVILPFNFSTLPPDIKLYWLYSWVIIPLLAILVANWYNKLDWVVQERSRAQLDEDRKFAEEDAQWAAYDKKLQQWEERQQLNRVVGGNPSDIARKVVEEMRRAQP